MSRIRVERLTTADIERARALFVAMAQVFETEAEPLSNDYLHRLLSRDDFWVLAATIDGQPVGGLTAYTLPLTRAEVSEVFIYDVAVKPAYHRQGIGRQLIGSLRAQATSAGINLLFVPADNEDEHALEFYSALGGAPAPVTIFTFSNDES